MAASPAETATPGPGSALLAFGSAGGNQAFGRFIEEPGAGDGNPVTPAGRTSGAEPARFGSLSPPARDNASDLRVTQELAAVVRRRAGGEAALPNAEPALPSHEPATQEQQAGQEHAAASLAGGDGPQGRHPKPRPPGPGEQTAAAGGAAPARRGAMQPPTGGSTATASAPAAGPLGGRRAAPPPAPAAEAASAPAAPAAEAASAPAAPSSVGDRMATEAPAGASSAAPVPAPAAPAALQIDTDAADPGTRAVLEQLSAAAAAGREATAAKLAAGAEAIVAKVEAHKQAVQQAGVDQAQAITSSFAGARDRLTTAMGAARATIEADAQAQQGALSDWAAGATGQAHALVDAKKSGAVQLGDDYAGKAIEAAESAAADTRSRIEGKAEEARSIGAAKAGVGSQEPDAAEAKAKAATDISEDTAANITHGVADVSAGLASSGAETAASLREQGQEAAAQLDAGLPHITAQLEEMRGTAAETLLQTAATHVASLDEQEGRLVAELAAQEARAQADLQAAVAAKQAELDAAGAQATAALTEQGQRALEGGDTGARELAEQVAAQEIDAEQGDEAGAAVTAGVAGGFAQLGATADDAIAQIHGALDQSGADALAAIGQVGGAVDGDVSGLAAEIEGRVTESTAAATSALAAGVGGVTTAGDEMLAQVGTDLNAQLAEVEGGFQKGLADFAGGLEEKVSEKERGAQEPVASLPARIDTTHAKIESEADKSWIEKQLSSLWSLLTDPGFWVALLVGILLTIVVIALLPAELTGLAILAAIAAFAAVGAIASGVGTIVSNVSKGRPWHQNLVENMLVGAVFGGVLAGVAIALGAAATTLIGIAALSATAGVLTVVTNVATGRPWDENLVANMLLVGVLSWAGKFIPRLGGKGGKGGPKDPVRPEDPAAKPAPVEEPVPGKPPVGLPPDLVAARSGLKNPRAIDQFDSRFNRICRDPAHPTPVELDRFGKYLDSARAKGGGDLETGLVKDWDAAHPAAKEPFGDARGRLADTRAQADAVRAELEAGRKSHPHLANDLDSMLNKRLAPEEANLAKMQDGQVEATTERVNGVRNNVDALRAEWESAKAQPDVTGLGKKKPLGGRPDAVDVDVVSQGGRRWVQVKNKEPFSTGSKDWSGEVRPQAEKNLAAAKDPVNLVDGKPPEVVFQFPKGVSVDVALQLRGMGVTVEGTLVTVPPTIPPLPVVPGRNDER